MIRRVFAGPCLAALGAACISGCAAPEPSGAVASATGSAPAAPVQVASVAPVSTAADPRRIGADRIAETQLNLPPGTERVPLLVVLHGLGGSGASIARALGVPRLAAERGFAWVAPDGDVDGKGRAFWNASKACCDFDGKGPDHVGSLRTLIQRATSLPRVDPARVYVVGYSNGGFMAHRLACDAPVAGIASIAGAGPTEGDAPCAPSGPVRVLEVHGDADDVVPFGGGHAAGGAVGHPGAQLSIDAWMMRNGCEAPGTPVDFDLEPGLEGAETQRRPGRGCRASTELWRVRGGTHQVAGRPAAMATIWDFLEGGPRPTP